MRPATSIPSYCHHKPRGLAYVRLGEDFVYLGVYGSPESKVLYERVVAEWLARGKTPPRPDDGDGVSINELLLAYWRFVEDYYRKPDGTPSEEQDKIAQAIRLLRSLYGETPAISFGPVALKAIRQKMIEAGLARNTINQRINCIRRAFRWAVGEEMVPPSVLHGLQAVAGLKYGRSSAKETQPVRAVPDAHVEAVLPFLSPTVAAMVQLQLLTGMRSGELCIMRTADIDTTGSVWLYRPTTHKTAHHGHSRVVQIGPKAQDVLRPYLKLDLLAHIFSPIQARAERDAIKRARRKTKVQPSQRNRKKRRPGIALGQRYDTKGYHRAVCYGIRQAWKAGVLPREVHWHPHQLRHSFATKVRKERGLDAARALLGQRSLAIADTYAEIDGALAKAVAAEMG